MLLALFAVLSALNAKVISSVRIKLNPGVEEHLDHHLFGFGKEKELPDYRVSIRDRSGWRDLGTKLNTSARDWLEYPVKGNLRFQSAMEIRVVEDDAIEDDVLDQVQIAGESVRGGSFEYRIGTAYRFEAGLKWFFDTAVGKAICLGITIAVVLLVLPYLPF